MLDRYSQKYKELKTLQVGDTVITAIKPDSRFPARGIGKIIKKFINDHEKLFWVIEIEAGWESNIDPHFLY